MSDEKKPEGLIAVIATTPEAGENYAKALGLEDYRVVTDYNHIQGLRTRALVVTPHYIMEANRAHWKAMENFDRGLHEVIMSGGTYGQ